MAGGLRFRVERSRSRFKGLGVRIQGLELKVKGLGFAPQRTHHNPFLFLRGDCGVVEALEKPTPSTQIPTLLGFIT